MWNRAAETRSRDELQHLQLTRLRATVARVLDSVPPSGERLRALGIDSPDAITSLSDLQKLPFSTKTELRERYPFGLFAVPREQVIRVHASSGTRGKPTLVGYTRHDLDTWSEVVARTLVLGGVRPGMVLHIAAGYGLFTGGFGFHMGGELLGCTVVPAGAGFTQRQITLMMDLGAQALKSTPSYALNLAASLRETGLSAADLHLEVGLFGAEPWTEAMRPAIESGLGLRAVNDYGLSEIIGPGVSAECIEVRNGMHIHEDHFLPEIIDPATGEALPPGATGELVFTTLTKEALPFIRYRTGDISSLDYTPCACGRTLARMSPVNGRIDDMLIIRGVNLFPTEVERVILSMQELGPNYQLIVDRPGILDELTVVCELAAADTDAAATRGRVAVRLQQEIGLSVQVDVRGPGGLERSEGKAVRVVDRRRLPAE